MLQEVQDWDLIKAKLRPGSAWWGGGVQGRSCVQERADRGSEAAIEAQVWKKRPEEKVWAGAAA